MAVLITYKGLRLWGFESKWLVSIAGALFIFPFFLFSPLAGQIADKFEKTKLIRYIKVWELAIMSVAVLGFVSENYTLLLVVLFCLGIQSAFFSPIKYSILPQILKPNHLVQGNAYVELGTFVSILVGTVLGGIAISKDNVALVVAAITLSVAIGGLLISTLLKPVAIGNPDLKLRINPIPTLCEGWKILRNNPAVMFSVLGISWFWFFGAGVISVLPLYCRDFLGANEQVVTAFLAIFTLGIGMGSILCEKLSFQKVEIGLVPIGSLGMTAFLLDLFFVIPSWTVFPSGELMNLHDFLQYPEGVRLLSDFFFSSVFGGLFIVPLYSLIQERSQEAVRSRVIAINNIVNAAFMVASTLLVIGFYWVNLTLQEIFLILASLNLIVAVYIYSLVPEFTLRLLSWAVVHLIYRLRIRGYENIPNKGAVILASNHVSFADWLVIMGAIGRPTRFIMYYKYYDFPIVRHLMRQAGVIRIAPKSENKAMLDRAYDIVSDKLRNGEVICIFPEGQITYDGKLQAFRPGVAKVLAKDPTPIIPMALNGLYNSLLSRKGGRVLFKMPRKFWQPIYLNIGKPIPPEEFSIELLRERIAELIEPEHDQD